MARFINALAAAAIIASAPAAAVTSAAWDFTASGQLNSNNNWSFGSAFTVNSAVKAVGLGIYSGGQTPVGNLVNLYLCDNINCTSTGSLIATATIDAGDMFLGNFVFDSVAAVSLATNTGYLVVGTMPLGYN